MEAKAMEVKKTNHQAVSTSAKEAHQVGFRAKSFISEIKDEIAQVTWTTPEELRTYTKIVVGATFFLGMGIYFMDVAIQLALTGLEYFVRLIAG